MSSRTLPSRHHLHETSPGDSECGEGWGTIIDDDNDRTEVDLPAEPPAMASLVGWPLQASQDTTSSIELNPTVGRMTDPPSRPRPKRARSRAQPVRRGSHGLASDLAALAARADSHVISNVSHTSKNNYRLIQTVIAQTAKEGLRGQHIVDEAEHLFRVERSPRLTRSRQPPSLPGPREGTLDWRWLLWVLRIFRACLGPPKLRTATSGMGRCRLRRHRHRRGRGLRSHSICGQPTSSPQL